MALDGDPHVRVLHLSVVFAGAFEAVETLTYQAPSDGSGGRRCG
jgi:hypothetical protein